MVVWLVLGITSGFFLRASDERALRNGTASPELVKQEAEHNKYREKERIKREQEEARKLAKRARESTKTPQSSGAESSVSMSFSDCKRIATSTGDELAGTQYKTTVHVDSSSFYEVEICTNEQC